jgi:hypothetical protein
MQTQLTKRINLTLEAGDLIRLFRVLNYVQSTISPVNDVQADASILLEELVDIETIVKTGASEPNEFWAQLDVEARYDRSSELISLTDIVVPGEKLPPVDPLEEAPPLS